MSARGVLISDSVIILLPNIYPGIEKNDHRIPADPGFSPESVANQYTRASEIRRKYVASISDKWISYVAANYHRQLDKTKSIDDPPLIPNLQNIQKPVVQILCPENDIFGRSPDPVADIPAEI